MADKKNTWYQEHKEYIREYNKQYYKEHREKLIEKSNERRFETNPDGSVTRGRKKMYFTEEERKNAIRKYRDKREKKNGVVNMEKHFKIRKDGFTCTIGTLNRLMLNTCYVEGKVVVVAVDDFSIYKNLREVMLNDIKEYLESQDMWDKKNRILIVDVPESYKTSGLTKTNTISFQYNLIRNGRTDWTSEGCINAWHKLHKGLEPFVEHHYQVIKNAVENNGTELAYRVGKLKDDLGSGFEDSTSDAS